MANCTVHMDREVLSTCRACGLFYCSECLVEGNTYYYCHQPACQERMKIDGDELPEDKAQPPVAVKLVTIGLYSHPYEADLARARLAAEGIDSFAADEFLVNLNWLYSNAVGGIRLQVAEPDVESARQILAEDSAENLPEEFQQDEPVVKCPRCGSSATHYIDLGSKWLTYLSWLVLMYPLIRFRKRMQCSDCKFEWKLKKNGSPLD